MKSMSRVARLTNETVADKSFTVETTFVLFFLAVELGQSFSLLALDSSLLAVTLLMIAVLPYFLYSENERPEFGKWILGRSLIAAFAIILGAAFKQTLGVLLPETFRFLPMTLLIVTAMISCYIQFYGFLKLRPAK